MIAKHLIQTLVALCGVAIPSAAFAQAHVDNPFTGATVYASPDYAAKVQTSIVQTTDAALRAKMQIVAQTPTFVWLDRMAAIAGSTDSSGLQEHLDNALAQQQGSTPIIAEFVIYDLPGRDCAALASNGEIPLTAAGLTTYKTQYIDPIVAIMSQPQYKNIRIVTVIEPDSLPNLVTNLSLSACAQANSTGIYVAGVQYALTQLHALPNVYTYVDIGHSGWLGWPNNASGAVTLFSQVATGTPAKFASIDGFVANTANDTALHEPFMTATQSIGGQPVMSANFYQFDPDIDEVSFTADMYQRFVSAGWPASLGFLIDTSRNGWGGSARPTVASTSTDLNTFVNATKIDPRPHRGLWCNQSGAGLGERPQASPPGFPASHLDAFVWVKPPGDSDGASSLIANDEGKGFDRMCDPTFLTQYNVLSNALPNAPLSGHWFHNQFVQLVQNALPVVGGGATPPPVCAVAPSAAAGVTAAAVSATQINLAWSAVSPPSNCAVLYNVYRSTTSGFTPSTATQIAAGLSTTAFSDPGRAASTTYFYIVETADGAGTAIARAQATTPVGGGGGCATAAPAVSMLTAAALSSSSIALAWSAVTPPAGCAVTYSVYRSTTPGFTPSDATLIASGLTTPSNTSTGLAASTAYQFVVVASDAVGVSAVTRATATTQALPGGGGGCHIGYTVVNSWATGFQVQLSIQNTSASATAGWTLRWTFAGSQQVSSLWNGTAAQSGSTVTVTNLSYNAAIGAGASYNDVGFTGAGADGATIPTGFTLNGVPCN
jgi:cellulose 1,4-beta-cellobiosidase